MTTVKPNTDKLTSTQPIVLSFLVTLLLAFGHNARVVANDANVTRLDFQENGKGVLGDRNNLSGHVNISEVFYNGGSFWSQGKPTALGEWMNKRSRFQVRFIPRDTTKKKIYLSPPRGIPWEEIDTDGLFKQPILFLDSDSRNSEIYLSEAECENLRHYLVERGGFLFVDDSSGIEGEFYRSIRRILEELLPMYPIEWIPDDHKMFRCFYHMGGAPVGMNPGNRPLALEGISINGRLAVVISQRGYWSLFTGSSEHYCPGAMRFGTNMIVYAVTNGNVSDKSEFSP
ncbi:MAG: DUF4159 domain-containing protein [Candidatus Poribacteria bacterium]|nr:DUF4159 domain-containing protein [Candidatus Poribacteria bacterium]MDE0503439.1 DUF4159 domain-containing protein [Candidatus Poribacteria bacterium]